MTNINNDNIWIDVETLAKLKNITRRSVRLALNQNKYEYKIENIRGGKTYKIKLSTLEEDLQLKYFQEYYDDYKTSDNEVIELSNLNIKQEKLISENQKKIALAKYDLIYAWLDFRKTYKRDRLKTGGNIPDKEFLQLYNTGMFLEEIFKTLGKVSIGSLYRWRALLDYKTNA
jgi:putative transposase